MVMQNWSIILCMLLLNSHLKFSSSEVSTFVFQFMYGRSPLNQMHSVLAIALCTHDCDVWGALQSDHQSLARSLTDFPRLSVHTSQRVSTIMVLIFPSCRMRL